jgi:hypothetical protein
VKGAATAAPFSGHDDGLVMDMLVVFVSNECFYEIHFARALFLVYLLDHL